jgi:hypothetical protein
MKKTSIYLPRHLAQIWYRERHLLFERLPGLLEQARLFKPTRERLRQRQYCPDGGIIISVYWPLSVYNRLHSFATATRISVSLLIAHLLLKLKTKVDALPRFLNYGFEVIEWSEHRLAFREELHFFTIPPPLTP